MPRLQSALGQTGHERRKPILGNSECAVRLPLGARERGGILTCRQIEKGDRGRSRGVESDRTARKLRAVSANLEDRVRPRREGVERE